MDRATIETAITIMLSEISSKLSEAESTVLAVRDVYGAYYTEMGGVGEAPEPPQARKPKPNGNVARHRPPKPQPAPSAARNLMGPTIRKSLPALLIFAGMVALIVAYRFLIR